MVLTALKGIPDVDRVLTAVNSELKILLLRYTGLTTASAHHSQQAACCLRHRARHQSRHRPKGLHWTRWSSLRGTGGCTEQSSQWHSRGLSLTPLTKPSLTRSQLCDPAIVDPCRELISTVLNEDVTLAKAPVELRNQRTYAVNVGGCGWSADGIADVSRLASMDCSMFPASPTRRQSTMHIST